VVHYKIQKSPSIREISSNKQVQFCVAFLFGGITGYYLVPPRFISQATKVEKILNSKVVLSDAIRRGVIFAKVLYSGEQFLSTFENVHWMDWQGNRQIGVYYDAISRDWESVIRMVREVTIEGQLARVPRALLRGLANGLLRIDENTRRVEFVQDGTVLDCDQPLKSQSGKPPARPPTPFASRQFLGNGQPMPKPSEEATAAFSGSFGFNTMPRFSEPIRPFLPNGKPRPGWKLVAAKDLPSGYDGYGTSTTAASAAASSDAQS
jgi:hypothetical protein